MLTLVFSNINGRRAFSFITAVVVALGITTFLVLVGMIDGTFREIAQRMETTNAHLMVHEYNWSGGIDKTWPLSLKYTDNIKAIDGVEAVIPIRIERIQELRKRSSRPISVYGISPDDFLRFCPPESILEGRTLQGGYDMVIDEVLAKGQGIGVGYKVKWLGGKEFTVVGIARQGLTVRVYIDGDTLAHHQDRARGRATFFFVKCTDPDRAEAVKDRINNIGTEHGGPRLTAIKLTEYIVRLREQFSLAFKVIYGVTVVSLVTSSMIIFLTMYQAVTERTREIGILKSLGASRRFLAGMVLCESLVLCVFGIGIGTLMSIGTKLLIENIIDPTMVVGITWGLFWRAGISGLAGAALGGLYPGYLAAQSDPVEALSYE